MRTAKVSEGRSRVTPRLTNIHTHSIYKAPIHGEAVCTIMFSWLYKILDCLVQALTAIGCFLVCTITMVFYYYITLMCLLSRQIRVASRVYCCHLINDVRYNGFLTIYILIKYEYQLGLQLIVQNTQNLIKIIKKKLLNILQ